MRTQRRRTKLIKRLLLIAVLLMLCVLAASYIIKLAAERAPEPDIADTAAEESAATAEGAESDEAAENETADENSGGSGAVSERVYAYRGSQDDAPYSMEAYDKAVEAGAAAIVMPFVVSGDGTLYVADDDYAESLTGYGGYFSGMTDGQISELTTKAGGKVLKLGDVLEKHGQNVHYVVELKYTSARNVEALEEIIRKYGCEDNVTISSAYFGGLRTVDSDLPDVPKVFMCSDQGEFNQALNLEQVDIISVSRELMTDENCKEAHGAGKKFAAWTLNTEEDIKAAQDMGADLYFTDEATLAAGLEGGN